jgi:hypothetical protein
MITVDSLPAGFKPYSTLKVCSNTVQGGGHLLVVENVLPLLVGVGVQPQVWLQAPTSASRRDYVLLVEASVSRHPAVHITSEADGLVVTTAGTVVLKVKQTGPDSAEITDLDLRPVGFNVYGTERELNAGGAHFTGNTAIGVGSLIAFG